MKSRKNNSLPTGFTPFAWAIGFFCLPIVVYPIALLLSPNIMDNPHLSQWTIRAMITFFWLYPFLLGLVSRIWYVVHQRNPRAGRWGLGLSIVAFYLIVYYILDVGFIYHLSK